MNRSVWKSSAEIQHALADAQRVALFSCGWCANLSDAGGIRGMHYMADMLRGWGKEVVLQRCFILCCTQESMAQAFRVYKKRLEKCDALVVISCSSGVKAAFLCNPPLRVVAVTDTVGSVPVTWEEDPVASSVCTSCGQCVITYTGGICPVSKCPAQAKYRPCPEYYEGRVACAQDPLRACIWAEIIRRGDLDALRELASIHETDGENRLLSPPHKPTPPWLRGIAGRIVAGVRGLPHIVPFLR